jgi:hypothetical protein
VLRPGGIFFAADFVGLAPLTDEERRLLLDEVGCPSVASSIEEYRSELVLAGFQVGARV